MPPKKRKRKTPQQAGTSRVAGEDVQEPANKIHRSDQAGQEPEANTREVNAIKKAIRAKQDWRTKIRDEEILARYKSEAAAQGANRKSISVAFNELLRESVVSTVDNILVLPTDDEDPDFDYEDFARGEYEEQDKFQRRDVVYTDDLVPENLRSTLEAQLDVIANAPEKDFHPGTDGKIQDLFHPSMFPYVRGVSFDRNAPQEDTKIDKEEKMDEDEEEGEAEEDDDQAEGLEDVGFDAAEERKYREQIKKLEGWDSIYQWLPAEYRVADDGEVSIDTYINNLDRETHPELYKTLAKVFRLFLPLFEKVLSNGKTSLNDRTLQVITKAANYVLKPGEEYSGNWHVEGMKHEHIIASGIYYYSTTDNLPGSHLAFRELRQNDLYERERSHNLGFSHNLGKVDTPMNRCLVFGNTLQHKVRPMKNNSKKMGVRKILCFFLVDPRVRIHSSLDIPEQQWDRVKRRTALAMCGVIKRLGIEFPPELTRVIVEFAQWGFTMDEALAHRLELMKERKYYVDQNNRIWQRSFSFCEH